MNGMECWVDPRLDTVRVAHVRSYLLARGWEKRPYARPELLVFQGPSDDTGQPILQILPSSENLADYRQRLLELITALAVIENRTAPAILDDMLRDSAAANESARNGAGSVKNAAPGLS